MAAFLVRELVLSFNLLFFAWEDSLITSFNILLRYWCSLFLFFIIMACVFPNIFWEILLMTGKPSRTVVSSSNSRLGWGWCLTAAQNCTPTQRGAKTCCRWRGNRLWCCWDWKCWKYWQRYKYNLSVEVLAIICGFELFLLYKPHYCK